MSTDTDGLDTGGRELTAALERAVDKSVYVSRGQRISAGSLRSAYSNRTWGDQRWLFFAGAELTTPADALAEFADALRPLLVDHLEPATDRVGNGLFSLFGGPGRLETPTVPEFGEVLVDGAVKLGASRVVELLLGWIAGAPLHIRRCAILQYFGASTKREWGVARTAFAQRDLDRAREIHLARHADGAGGKRKELDQAISRWMKSKQSSQDSDRLIELRIALEALYGKGAMNEKAFRVSTYDAWHLGGTVDERRHIRETLLKAYDDASRAIHAGELKHTKRDEQLLPTAQAFCLRGILKRLEKPEAPAWDELILGGLTED